MNILYVIVSLFSFNSIENEKQKKKNFRCINGVYAFSIYWTLAQSCLCGTFFHRSLAPKRIANAENKWTYQPTAACVYVESFSIINTKNKYEKSMPPKQQLQQQQ